MGIIEISLFVIIFLQIVIKGEENKKHVVVLGMIILFLLAALREPNPNTDAPRYVASFEKWSKYTFSSMRRSMFLENIKDPVYHYTGWAFSKIFKDPQWWLAAIASLYSVAVGRLLDKESKQPTISLVMLVSLGFFSFSLTGLRQTVAMSILILSYPFLKERRFIPFAILVFIASRYHTTALVFLLVYPIAKKELGIYHIVIAVIAFMIFYVFRGWLLGFLGNVLQEERFEGYTSGNAARLTMAGFAIQTVCFGFSLYYYKRMIQMDKNYLVLYNLSFMGWVFQLFSSLIAEIFRISMYFSIFNIILIANATTCEEEKRSRSILQMVVIAIFILYMLRDGKISYNFLWQ